MSSPLSPPPHSTEGYVIAINRSDRWSIYQRFQELHIPCSCPLDGSLRVDIRNGLDIVLIRSVVQRMTAPRTELINWLERCGNTPMKPSSTAIVTHQRI